MPEPLSAWTFWGYFKVPFHWAWRTIRLQDRVTKLENEISLLQKEEGPSPHRKCPKCGERDFRLQDKYRYKPDIFEDQRFFHEKWRCFSCGHFEENNIPEPGG